MNINYGGSERYAAAVSSERYHYAAAVSNFLSNASPFRSDSDSSNA